MTNLVFNIMYFTKVCEEYFIIPEDFVAHKTFEIHFKETTVKHDVQIIMMPLCVRKIAPKVIRESFHEIAWLGEIL